MIKLKYVSLALGLAILGMVVLFFHFFSDSKPENEAVPSFLNIESGTEGKVSFFGRQNLIEWEGVAREMALGVEKPVGFKSALFRRSADDAGNEGRFALCEFSNGTAAFCFWLQMSADDSVQWNADSSDYSRKGLLFTSGEKFLAVSSGDLSYEKEKRLHEIAFLSAGIEPRSFPHREIPWNLSFLQIVEDSHVLHPAITLQSYGQTVFLVLPEFYRNRVESLGVHRPYSVGSFSGMRIYLEGKSEVWYSTRCDHYSLMVTDWPVSLNMEQKGFFRQVLTSPVD